MTKKNIVRASAVALAFCLLATAAPAMNADAAGKTKLSKKKITVKVGKTKKLKVKNLKGKKVKWKTSNKKVVKIKKTGKKTVVKLKGKKAGTATITAKIGKKTFKCKVIITDNRTSNEDIFYDKKNGITMDEWENCQKVVKEVLGTDINKFSEMERCTRLAMWVCDYMTYSPSTNYLVSDQTAGSAFNRGGKGVCAAYTDLYFILLKVAGVDCRKVEGSTFLGVHTWNLVKINGDWYNCDTTGMDNYNTAKYMDGYPSVSPTYYDWDHFMKSDNFLMEHWGITEISRTKKNQPYCTSTKYDNNQYAIDPDHGLYIDVEDGFEEKITYHHRSGNYPNEVFYDITEEEFQQALNYYNTLPDNERIDYSILNNGGISFGYFNDTGNHLYSKVVTRTKKYKKVLQEKYYIYDNNIFTRGG